MKAFLTSTVSILSSIALFAASPPNEDLIREPVIVVAVGLEAQTLTIRFPPKSKFSSDYRPILDVHNCKVVRVLPTNCRKVASLGDLKPNMEVLVTGNCGRWVPRATEIRMIEK